MQPRMLILIPNPKKNAHSISAGSVKPICQGMNSPVIAAATVVTPVHNRYLVASTNPTGHRVQTFK
jgi:hypothetical protein